MKPLEVMRTFGRKRKVDSNNRLIRSLPFIAEKSP